MDGLSGAASVIAVLSVAIQIADGLNKLKLFWGSVKSSHSDAKAIIEDIELLQGIIEVIRKNCEKFGSDETTETALRSCQSRIVALNQLAQDISIGCTSLSKRKRIWTPFKAAMKQEDVQKFQNALHDAKLSLVLARQTSSFTITQNNLTSIQTGIAGLKIKSITKQYLCTVPFERDLKFISRGQAMTSSHKLLAEHRKVGLAGIGGVGKSQLAIEICYCLKDQHPHQHIIWIYARTVNLVEQAYISIAKSMRIPGWDDPTNDRMKLVWEWLGDESNGKWVLVLDSADDLEVFFEGNNPETTGGQQANLARYIPQCSHGTLIVTSRDRRVCQRLVGNDCVVGLGSMSDLESTDFLKSRLSSPQSSYSEILLALATALDNIPLAMSQAAAFISENNMEFAEYHQLLESSEFGPLDMLDEDLNERRRDCTAQSSIFQTWKISFDHISKNRPAASELLALMAMLDRQDIPKSLLQHDGERPVDFHKALGTLQAFALVIQQQGQQTYSMHRLVQLATRRWLLAKGEQSRYQVKALTRLAQRFPKGQYETRTFCAELCPHARTVLSYDGLPDLTRLDSAMLMQNLASFDIMQGRLYQARDYQKKCIEIRQTNLGRHHISTLECTRDLACNLRDLAEFREAEQLHRDNLQILESSGQTLQPIMLTTKSDLADLLWSLGIYLEAETLAREAVFGQTNLLGPSHIETTTSMGVLSLILCALAKKEEATGNPKAEMANFACSERYREAACLGTEVFRLRKTILGPSHPHTLVSMNNLSWILRNKGDFAESELLNREALARKEKELGKDHYDTLNCKYCLAVVLGCQDQHKEAEQVYREHLEAVARVLGEAHPNTMRSMRGLGKALEAQGEITQALETYRNAYEGLLKSFGPDHVSTMESKTLLETLSAKMLQNNRYNDIFIDSHT